eukprot:Gb_23357 [translate_table: standard]
MFKLQRQRAEKPGEKIDFKFLQFHATRVPNGWDKLIVSVISVETGKAIARTNKALVRSGSCQWAEAVSESIRFLQDDNSKELEERLLKFVVSMGSTRSGILGEATINLADYLSSKVSVPLSMPLKKCNHGTILHVKVQCLTPRAGSRESEQWRETAMEQDDQNSVSDDADSRSESSDYMIAGSVGSSSGNRFGGSSQRTKDGASSSATSRLSSDSIEFLSTGSGTANGNAKNVSHIDQVSPSGSLHRIQDSAGSRDGSTTNRAGNGRDTYKSSPSSSINGKGSGAMVQKQWPDRATQGSHVGTDYVNRGPHTASLVRSNDSSKGFLEAAEVTIQELRTEAMMWERNARKLAAEMETLKQQLSDQAKHHSDLGMELSAAQAERDSFQLEVEQLKSTLQSSAERGSSLDNARFEAEDAKRTVKELQEEIKLQKQTNANLDLQLMKTQEANMELVSALRELEETIQQQDAEIDKFSEERKKLHDLESLRQEYEGARQHTESGVQSSTAEAERDSLKQEMEQLKSALQASIATAGSEAEDAERTIKELQEEIETERESNQNLNLQLQKTQESYAQLQFAVQELEERLKKQGKEIEHLSAANEKFEASVSDEQTRRNIIDVEAEWMQKLLSKEEEIRRLEDRISGFEIHKPSTEVTECRDESQEDLRKALETLRREMDELERDCKELTDENMELIYKLTKSNKDLELKNAYIVEMEEKLPVDSTIDADVPANVKRNTCRDGVEINGQITKLKPKSKSSESLYTVEFAGMEASPNQFKNQVIELQNQNSVLEIELRAFKDRVHNLESELQTVQKETVENESGLVAKYEHRLKAIEARAVKAENELADSLKRIESFEFDSSKDEMVRIISEHDKQLKNAAEHAAIIQNELDHTLKKIADLESDLESRKGELLKESAERHNGEILISNLHQLNGESETRIQELEAKHLQAFSLVSEHEARVSQLQQQIDSCALRETHLQQTIEQLESLKIELHSEIQDLKEEQRVSRSGVQELEFQLTVLTEEIQVLRSSRREFEMRASNLQMEKVALEDKLEVTQDESKATRERMEELDQELGKITVCMESEISAKRSLEKKAMELERNKEELESHLTDLEVENVQLSERISGLEAQLRYMTEERESYRLDLENTKARGLDIQADLHRLESELREENVELQQRLQESEKLLSGALEEAESRKRENRQLQLKLEGLTKENASVQELKAELQEELSNLYVSHTSLEEQLQKVTERFSSSVTQVKSLESELATLQREISDKERVWGVEMEALLVFRKEHEQKLVRAEAELSQVHLEKASAVEHLQNEVRRLTEQMSSTFDEKERMATQALVEASELRAAKVKLEDSLQQIQCKARQCETELLSIRQEYETKVQELLLQVTLSKEREEEMNARQLNTDRQLEDVTLREAEYIQRLQDLEMNITVIESERQKLKEEHASLSNQVYELVSLRDEMAVLKSTVEDVETERNRLESSLHSTDAELGRSKAEKVSLMEMLATLQQAISEGDEVRRCKAALEEKLLRLQAELSAKEASSAHEAEQKNESIRLKRLNGQLQRKLQDLEEEKEEFKRKAQLLEEELQVKVNTLSKVEQKVSSRSNSKVGYTSPSRDTKEVVELREKLRFVESELEIIAKEFEVKERGLCAKIEKLENVNQQLVQAQSNSNTNQLQVELINLQKQTSTLSQRENELLSKLGAQELLQKELQRLQEDNKRLQTQLLRFRETVKMGDILDRVFDLETELTEALEANTMYKSQLRSFLCEEQNVHVAALQNFGSVDQVVNDLFKYKKTASSLEAELKDMQDRYFRMSLQFAEVEAQREELVMTIKNMKNGRRWF